MQVVIFFAPIVNGTATVMLESERTYTVIATAFFGNDTQEQQNFSKNFRTDFPTDFPTDSCPSGKNLIDI